MSFSLNERTQQLNQLSEFINRARNTFLSVLNQLGWDDGHLQRKPSDMVSCPLNAEHRVPQEKLQQHFDSCSWKTEGYHNLDTPLPECCGTGFGSVTIGKTLRIAILQEAVAKYPNMKLGFTGLDTRPLPKTADRLVADFTPDERRVMYDYAVAKSGAFSDSKTDLPMEFQKDDEKKEKPKTMLEKLAEERDAKRRRVSYRNKKVHTNRKSQTEILREVIQNQMELYEEWLKLENREIFGTAVSEERTNAIQPAEADQERSSNSAVVDCNRDNVESSFENRKIPYQYIAKLRRKKGNPYAIARKISDYMENVSQSGENLDELNYSQANFDSISGDRNSDRYPNQDSITSSIKNENSHRRSKAYEFERSYKSENKVCSSHYYSGRRRNSSSPESEKRNVVSERYKSCKLYGRSSNTRYKSCTKHIEKDRSYSPKREHQNKYETVCKRDERSSLDAKRSDYCRLYDEDQEKRYETSEYRKQGSNEYPECSNHRKHADNITTSREKNESTHFKKHRKEKHYENATEKRYYMDSPRYHSTRSKHERYKHHHSSNRDKYKANDSSESSQQSSKYSATSSDNSDSDKKYECTLEHLSYSKSYKDNESRNKINQNYVHEERVRHQKHKHKKKHKYKRKKQHIKRESRQGSEHSSSDFSC